MNTNNKILLTIILAILFAWSGSALLTMIFIDNWADRGTFGDLFGGINSLFSGLALAGLVYSIFRSREQIHVQREEIEINRKELIKSRKTQEKSEKALEEQVAQMKISTKINGLKTLIDYYSSVIANPETPKENKDNAILKRKALIIEIDQLINRIVEEDVE